MKERETYGVKFVVSGETFDEYKGTLQDQLEEAYKEIERLNNIINELKEVLIFDIKEFEVLKKENDKEYYLGRITTAKKVLSYIEELKEK